MRSAERFGALLPNVRAKLKLAPFLAPPFSCGNNDHPVVRCPQPSSSSYCSLLLESSSQLETTP